MNDLAPDDELTAAEAAAFAALPRENSAYDQVAEERTVQALRTNSLLGPARGKQFTRYAAIASGVAAALLIFTAGALFGRQFAAHEVQSASPSIQVQQAGSAYVAALVRLSSASDTERSPGLEVGTATLRAAATSLARVSPNDPIALRIRTSLSDDTHPIGDRSVIWF